MSEVAAEQIEQKWREYAEAVEALAARVGDPDDFPVESSSSLAGDDAKSHPFEVSLALRHIINASVDQLHGVKVVVRDANYQHLAVSNTLVRAALENTATGLWILGPKARPERIERALRWHARNYHDFANYVTSSGSSAADMLKRNAGNLDLIGDVAERLGINAKRAKSGFKVTEPIKGGAQYTDLPVYSDWQITSGFAHGRPWAHHGFLHREQVDSGADGHPVYRMTARKDITLYFAVQALHLLGELLRLRDRRAGLAMPPRPDGLPDHEPKARQPRG
ncbi:hypothetical protein ABW16_06595 [Mycolicibacter heraklionensis]|uniref:Uncharacterized protein n=1 Tax=Mycolicibacter heraklionensis TaxID=512402 RepID=A0A9X7WF49_9MYCO|nr:hypothetical protein [Mycolicibacter heraklionensis]KLO30567.1 hypothetical protein ABW16_06595 [Mycolicibacter heraklionensis]QZA07043.1 hypothetical protein K3U94_19065 [Mycolicibacter heraklionensis]